MASYQRRPRARASVRTTLRHRQSSPCPSAEAIYSVEEDAHRVLNGVARRICWRRCKALRRIGILFTYRYDRFPKAGSSFDVSQDVLAMPYAFDLHKRGRACDRSLGVRGSKACLRRRREGFANSSSQTRISKWCTKKATMYVDVDADTVLKNR